MTVNDWLRSEPIGWLMLPDRTDRVVPVVVRLHDGESPGATVFDSLERIPEQDGYDWPQERVHPIVIGQTNLGDVTFVDCLLTYWFTRHDGIALRWAGNLEARTAFVGASYPTVEALKFCKIRLRLDGIDLWSGLLLASVSWVESTATVTVDTSQTRQFSINDIRVAITTAAVQHSIGNGIAKPQRPLLAVEQSIEAESDTPLDVAEWNSRLIEPLRFFHGFTLGRLMALRALHRVDTVDLPGRERQVDRGIPLIAAGIEQFAPADTDVLAHPLALLSDLEPQVMMTRWFDLWTDARKQTTIRRLLHAATDATSTKSRFNDLVEAAEGWHKAMHGGRSSLVERLIDLASPATDWTAQNYTPSIVRP